MKREANALLKQSLSQTTFIVIDLETTGASPKNGSGITEIGAVKIRAGEILGTFQTFVNPLALIPTYITELTGITNEMVALAPIIDEVLPDLFTFFENADQSVLVAHNSPFDMGFLMSAAHDCDLLWPGHLVIDTVKLARRVLSREEAPNCKLSTLAYLFDTEIKPTHRALDDAMTTVDVLHGLFERYGNRGVTNLSDLIALIGQRRPRRN